MQLVMQLPVWYNILMKIKSKEIKRTQRYHLSQTFFQFHD
jgi:hypothetical protein